MSELLKSSLNILIPALALTIGLLFGSFYTALADRILYFYYGKGRKSNRKWEKIFFKPSFCFNCNREIEKFFLIPILGFILTGGKCRHCKSRIGIIRLLGELYPGILLLSLILLGEKWAFSFFTLLFIGNLYISIATDWNFFLLDYENSAFLYLWGFSAIFSEYGFGKTMQYHIYTALFVFIILLILFIIGRGEKFGMGDLILAPSLAFYLGPLKSIFLFQSAASLSILFILFIQKNRKAPSPFGAFMAISFFLIQFADVVLRFYNIAVLSYFR